MDERERKILSVRSLHLMNELPKILPKIKKKPKKKLNIVINHEQHAYHYHITNGMVINENLCFH